MGIEQDYSGRDGMGYPKISGKKAWLICGECSESHPIWKAKQAEAKTEA